MNLFVGCDKGRQEALRSNMAPAQGHQKGQEEKRNASQGAENEPSNLGAGVLAVSVFVLHLAERVDKKPLEKFKM